MPTPPLPPGWTATPSQDGAVDLYVDQTKRPYFVAVVAVGALTWTGAVVRAFVGHTAMPLAAAPAFAWLLVVLLIAFTIWCAFADESWRLSPGIVEHRVGWGRATFVWRIAGHSGRLMIGVNYTTTFSKPFFRLYALTSGTRRFLIERDLAELQTLANFIASHTGWQVEPFVPFTTA